MVSSSLEPRLWKILVLVAATLILGLFIGLILGWQVWPVHWYDVDPSDLRLQHQISYVLMTADSLTLTGNVEAAKDRLYELLDEHTSLEQVSNLVERVAVQRDTSGDGGAAERLRRLSEAAGLPDPRITEYQSPGQRVTSPARWGTYLLLLGGVLLSVAIALWILRQFRPTGPISPDMEPETDRVIEEPATALSGARWDTVFSRRPSPREPLVADERDVGSLDREPEDREPLAVEPLMTADLPEPEPRFGAEISPERRIPGEPAKAGRATPFSGAPLPPWDLPEEQEPADEGVAPEPTTVAAVSHQDSIAPEGALGIFEARYAYGDDDLDLSFVIESSDKDFLGECGIGVIDVLRAEGGQQVDAFEIWLFDRGDVHAESRAILVSDYAYRTPAVNARLSARGRLVLAQPGLQIPLETLSLRMTATLSDFGYVSDSQPPNSFFSHLVMQFVAERNTAAT